MFHQRFYPTPQHSVWTNLLAIQNCSNPPLMRHARCNTPTPTMKSSRSPPNTFAQTTFHAVPIIAHISPILILSQESDRRTVFQNEGSIDWQQHIKGPPTYYPTAEQFRNPLVFIQSIQAEACHFGEEIISTPECILCALQVFDFPSQIVCPPINSSAVNVTCKCRNGLIFPQLSLVFLQMCRQTRSTHIPYENLGDTGSTMSQCSI